jgi:transcriptional regulator with XRE-family HTH domain
MGASGVDIAGTLRERRRALGLTRARLADRTGITAADIARWERGEEVPDPEAVVVLADAIGLEVTETQAWLDEVTIDLTGVDVSVELVESDDTPSDSFAERTVPRRDDSGLLHRIADRLASRDERAGRGPASVTPIRPSAPRRPSPSSATGLVRAPRQASQLPSVFPEPAFAPYDPAVHVYAAGPLKPPSDAEEQMYLLRRINTTAVLIGLGLLLWWASGSLWEGFGDVIDLFRAPVTGG